MYYTVALHWEDISVGIRGKLSPDHTCCGQSYATSTQQHRIYAVSCHHQIHGKGGFPDKYEIWFSPGLPHYHAQYVGPSSLSMDHSQLVFWKKQCVAAYVGDFLLIFWKICSLISTHTVAHRDSQNDAFSPYRCTGKHSDLIFRTRRVVRILFFLWTSNYAILPYPWWSTSCSNMTTTASWEGRCLACSSHTAMWGALSKK